MHYKRLERKALWGPTLEDLLALLLQSGQEIKPSFLLMEKTISNK